MTDYAKPYNQRNTRGRSLPYAAQAAASRIDADPDLARRASGAGGVVSPEFRGDNAKAQTITAQEWILSGPYETGKTWAALWRLDKEASTTPKGQYALIRKVRNDMDASVLVTWKRVIERSKSGAVVYGGERAQWYDYPNGARVWVGGLDRPEKTLSGERDGIYVNQAEELAVEDWELLTRATTGRGAVTDHPMLFGDCNPGPADHWILKRKDAGDLILLESHHEDNPALFDADGILTAQGQRSMTALNKLTGIRKQRGRYGLWVGAEGQFFEQWDADVHTCEPFDIPADWPLWGAFDYGFVHNTAFGLFTRNEGTVYLIGEHVKNKATVRQHADAIGALCARVGVPIPRKIVAGHDVFSNRGDSQGLTIAEQYAAYGLEFERADIDRINGAAALMERLGVEGDTEKGIPAQPATFQAFTTCYRTIGQIPAMIHNPRQPEDVLKVDSDADGNGGDDAYDMLRYGVMALSEPIKVVRAKQTKLNVWREM